MRWNNGLHNQRVKTFSREFYESSKAPINVALSIVGVLLALLAFGLSGDKTTISLKILLPVLIILYIVIIALISLCVQLYLKTSRQLPRVIRFYKPTAPYTEAEGTLLLESSNDYSHDIIVSVYYSDRGREVQVGTGFVAAIQDDGLIQVVVSQSETSYRDIWEQIHQNNKDALIKLFVKPFVSKTFIEGQVQ